MTEQPAQPQMPPREPYNIRHARHMAERAAAEDARRARHGRPPKGTADHAGTCLIFGILLGLAGAIGPRIPGYLVSQSGVRWSVASYHEACTSGFGELAQAGHPGVSSAPPPPPPPPPPPARLDISVSLSKTSPGA
jgi:hypothetical protein